MASLNCQPLLSTYSASQVNFVGKKNKDKDKKAESEKKEPEGLEAKAKETVEATQDVVELGNEIAGENKFKKITQPVVKYAGPPALGFLSFFTLRKGQPAAVRKVVRIFSKTKKVGGEAAEKTSEGYMSRVSSNAVKKGKEVHQKIIEKLPAENEKGGIKGFVYRQLDKGANFVKKYSQKGIRDKDGNIVKNPNDKQLFGSFVNETIGGVNGIVLGTTATVATYKKNDPEEVQEKLGDAVQSLVIAG